MHKTKTTLRASSVAVMALTGLALAGCSSGSSGVFGGSGGGASPSESRGGGGFFRSLNFFSSGPDAPPASASQDDDGFECPKVEIADGGSTLRQAADAEAVRVQLSIGQTARECTLRGGGAFGLKVGAELIALTGIGGHPGQYDATLRSTVMRGQQVVATSVKRIAIVVPPGETRGTAVLVDDGISVGPGDNSDLTLEISLGTAGGGAAATKRRRHR